MMVSYIAEVHHLAPARASTAPMAADQSVLYAFSCPLSLRTRVLAAPILAATSSASSAHSSAATWHDVVKQIWGDRQFPAAQRHSMRHDRAQHAIMQSNTCGSILSRVAAAANMTSTSSSA